jgi:hypothetical protein
VRGPGLVGREGVEDAVAGVIDLERVPGDGASLGDGQLTGGLEEVRQLAALPGLASGSASMPSVTVMGNGVLSTEVSSQAVPPI